MRRTARNVVSVAGATALVALLLALFAGPAEAIEAPTWEAGTCIAEGCNYGGSPSEYFTQAAGHPNFGVTNFVFKNGEPKNIRVDLPEGLNVNPQAVPQCAVATFEANPAACAASEIGKSEVTSSALPILTLPFPVYNLEPKQGEPALFGFNVNAVLINFDIFLETEIEWGGDYHEAFKINGIPNTLPVEKNRLVFFGDKNAFLTLPSQCNGPSTSLLGVEPYSGASISGQPTTPPAPIADCAKAPFAPTVTATASGPTDSSVPVSVSLNVPQFPGAGEVNTSTVKNANVTLPVGTGLNPATAPGLKFCPNNAFPLKGKAAITCPAESQVGTVAIEAPELPAGSLKGPVYLATQESNDPTSGKEYRIFFNAESARYGVQVREEGRVKANPTTGQLSAEFTNLPQVAFSSATLTFGPQAKHAIPVLSSPPLCINTATSTAVPYSTGVTKTTATTELKLTQAPGGAPCAKTMAERPFAPGFNAKPVSSKALTYTPYQLTINRPEGQQEVKGFNITLPPGATAKLAGIPYCAAKEYGAAANITGAAEEKNSSCQKESLIGVATIQSGTGATPLKLEGKVYLSGPYKGAPLSIVVITPAVAGPFDLGNVVVHAPLALNPETGVVSTSAEIPDVYGGVKLDIRSIFVNLNRKEFTLNGTNCAKSAVTGIVQGGGADPTNPAVWSSFPVSSPFEAEGCNDPEGRTGQRRARLGGAAAHDLPRSVEPRDGLHAAPVRRRRMSEEIGLRPRDRLLAAAGETARRAGRPALLEQHPS
jgi:hypothetical protein